MRPGITLDECVILLGAVADGLALRAPADPAAPTIDHARRRCLLIGAVAGWQLARARAGQDMRRLGAQAHAKIAHWRGETERARASAALAAEQAAAWVAGCQQGREDLLSLTRALARQAGQPGRQQAPDTQASCAP